MLDSSMSLQMSISVDELNCLNNALLGILTTLMFLYFYLFFFLSLQGPHATKIQGFFFWIFFLTFSSRKLDPIYVLSIKLYATVIWRTFFTNFQNWGDGRFKVMAVNSMSLEEELVENVNSAVTYLWLSISSGKSTYVVCNFVKKYAFSFFSRCIHGS